MPHTFDINRLRHADKNNFLLIAGPCVVESKSLIEETAGTISSLCDELGIPFIFKSSYRKANRSKLSSFTGIGDEKALDIMAAAAEDNDIPLVTDIHTPAEAEFAAQFVDMLQIPAFLCRQTELLCAAGNTGKPVNIKKGQFLAPEAMAFAKEKVESTGNQRVLLTERGMTFGYNDLVVDFRGIPVMQETGAPVILDLTHALQQPNQGSGVTGGDPSKIATLGRAGIGAGVDGVFVETHPDPDQARSDGANMLSLNELEGLLKQLLRIHAAVHH